MGFTVEQSKEFEAWLLSLTKLEQSLILIRFTRVERGNWGDHRNLAKGVIEFRFKNSGKKPLRVYGKKQGTSIILIVSGGTKKRQSKDILNVLGSIK